MRTPTDQVRRYATGLLLLLIGLAWAGSVSAQPAVSLRGNVGATFLQSPELEQQIFNSGVDAGLAMDVEVYRGFSVTIHGAYDQFTLNRETAQRIGGGTVRVGDLSFLSGSIGLRYTFQNDSDAQPYVAAGVGLYQARQTNQGTFGSGEGATGAVVARSATREGFHVAAGANFRLDDTYAVFFEPRYVFVTPGPDGFLITDRGDEDPRYFALRLGLDVQLWR